ncbi:MAG: endonuclease/exonuclease/phosphatase family protein [Granulosicoccus sp.]
MTMRIVSWNILQGGGKRAENIAQALSDLAPDILILQEYRNNKGAATLLAAIDSLELEHRAITEVTARKNTVLIASKFPISTSVWAEDLDAALAIRARIDFPSMNFDILAGHLPHKRAQRPYFEALLDDRALIEKPAIIIGDLNCGIPFEDSDTKTFDNTHMFQSLLKRGWTDSWRSRNPGAREFTWVSPRGNGYRYDHCLSTASMDARISVIGYEHQLRESGLSDHSALFLDIA